MMDAPAFLPYDSRSPPGPHMQQQEQPQHHHQPRPLYMVAPPYSSGHLPNPPPPQQHHYPNQQTFAAYVSYHSPPPSTTVGSPYRHDPHERLVHGHGSAHHAGSNKMPAPESNAQRSASYRRGSRQANDARLRSPSARSESQASTTARSATANIYPTANSKDITYNETINPADRVNFETDVDELMKAIQVKEEREEAAGQTQAPTPAQTPTADHTSGSQSPVSTVHKGVSRPPAEQKPKKKWVCDGPSCNKRFVQKTHLDIHRRTHSGQKPYVCTKDNCGLTFSQRGNLKTHMRRHTGEKPYSCSICGKLFAQRGNVRSHEETHKGLKPFVCRLDECNKTFSQLGNMKTHQNNFHKETLQRLTEMFIRFAQMDEVPEQHRELFDYFKAHYKNSNKGIKGRGKARTVAPKQKPSSAQAPSMASFPHLPMPTPQPNSYVSRHHQAPPGPNCGIFEPHHANGPPPNMLYEDDHARHVVFPVERMY